MKNLLKFAAIFAIFTMIFTTGCKDDEPEVNPTSFTTLKDHLKSANMDLPDMLASWVIDAKPVDEGGIVDVANGYTIPGYHVFDIRDQASFNDGHINGAMQVDLKDVVTKAANYTDKPILVACASGQTAGHAVMALRLSGYTDAKVLKWGMSGWNEVFAADFWDKNAGHENGNVADGNANWVTTDAPALQTDNDYPAWSTTSTDGAGILTERINKMLGDGFKTTSSDPVLADPGAYQIVNYWPETVYKSIGHFNGAYQIETIELTESVLGALDPSKETLVYCYTGQTSSMAVAWLNVLGYNAKSIAYGVNRLKYDAVEEAGKPNWHGSFGYEYVTE